MTIPTDLAAKVAVRTRNKIDTVEPQFADKTSVKYLGERGKDVRIYEVRFNRLRELCDRAHQRAGQ
jgi:hypothetical protein